MPNDYCVNKVLFGNATIMDISDTTASPEDVAEGEIFYAANGARSVGTGSGGGGGAEIDDTTIALDKTWSSNKISTELGGKVDKENGKGLSTEDYTTVEKTKLNNIDSGAQVNTIESITINGVTVTPDANKDVSFMAITNTVNDLENYYLKTQTYTKTEVDSLISAISSIHFEVVNTLPTTDIQTNIIYLVPSSSSTTENIKDEYINLDGTTSGWEKIGTTDIDLSNYIQKSETNGLVRNDGSIDINNYAKPIELTPTAYNALPSTDKEDPSKIYFVKEVSRTEAVTWGGFSYPVGVNVWTDGNETYYSYENAQYKLNGTTWEPISWQGLTSFNGQYIWTDGASVYYSNNSDQYKLNGTTWEAITWQGVPNVSRPLIWSDGTDIYFSANTNAQYKLNGTTWEHITWNGFTDINGQFIWTDGTNVYYSNNYDQYKLNGTTWEPMTWNGLTAFGGENVWSDGINMYYSANTNQYKLNNTTWEPISWGDYNSFYAQYIWTDGINMYHSLASTNQSKFIIGKPSGIYYKNTEYQSSAGGEEYVLPIAGTNVLGGIKVGNNLYIDSSGVLNAVGGGGATYTAGDGIDIENATISLDIDYLTASRLGVIPTIEKGINNGVATLDSTGRVPSSQLPSYVDDVVEYADRASFPATGEGGKIYIAIDTNKSYRWSGTTYVEISSSLALGETAGTAYEGNKGKTNADNIAVIQGLIPSNATTSNKLATASDIPNTTDFIRKSETSGLIKNDGSIDTNTYLTQHQDISGKADKVSNATNGNFAGLDINGNLVDSGHKPGDYSSPIRLTTAEYNALTNEQKHDTTKIYYITDASSSSIIPMLDENIITTTFSLHQDHPINRIIKDKTSNMVTLDLTLDSTVSATAWSTEIGVVPEGYRPSVRLRILGWYGIEAIAFDITPTGKIVSSTNISGKDVWLHATWYVA